MPERADDMQPLLGELSDLVSEGRNARTRDIDLLPTRELLDVINREDMQVAHAVQKVVPEIARAVDEIVASFRAGGRLVYIGAGTSGRLGVLDAAECPPTFGVPAGMVLGIVAGGLDALFKAVEGAEDDAEGGAAALRAANVSGGDVVVGIASSGRTPYVMGALAHARQVGATTVALACNPAAAIADVADIAILPVVGPEVLAGSTRLKSGTAQKLVLNMLSTASMIRMGKSYGNFMVDLHATNKKLLARSVRIVMESTGCDTAEAEQALERTDNDVKLAILTRLTGLAPEAARSALAAAGGFLRAAIDGNRTD